jgi:dUTP pyrophosphatase
MPVLKIKYLDLNEDTKKLSLPREGDVGIDLYSTIDIQIPYMRTVLIPTGVSIEVPEEYWLNIRDRSSMSKNYHVLAGVIDSSYRNEIKIRMLCHNETNTDMIKRGDKIAQLIICKNYNKEFTIEEAEELSDTERGQGGFGSTGR